MAADLLGDANDLLCILSDNYFDDLLDFKVRPLQTPGSNKILHFDRLRDAKPTSSTSTSTSTSSNFDIHSFHSQVTSFVENLDQNQHQTENEKLSKKINNATDTCRPVLPVYPISTNQMTPLTKKHGVTSTPTSHTGRWTTEEHRLFLQGLQKYGKSWKKIACLVPTRTLVQIRTHAQKFLMKNQWDQHLPLPASGSGVGSGVGASTPLVSSNSPSIKPKTTKYESNTTKSYPVRLQPASAKHNNNMYPFHPHNPSTHLPLPLPAQIPYYHHPITTFPAEMFACHSNKEKTKETMEAKGTKKRRLSAAICESESRAKLVLEMPTPLPSDDIFENISDILDGENTLDWLSALDSLVSTPPTSSNSADNGKTNQKPIRRISIETTTMNPFHQPIKTTTNHASIFMKKRKLMDEFTEDSTKTFMTESNEVQTNLIVSFH